MGSWNSPLELDFPELFSSLDRKGFALLDSKQEGIRIYADKLEYQDGLLSGNLLLTYAFTRQFYTSYQRIAKAIVVTIENADTGQCTAIKLTDPHKVYPGFKGDNYSPDKAHESQGIKTSYREIPFGLEIVQPGWGPHLFIRAQLQKFSSNTLALNISDKVLLDSYMNAHVHDVIFMDEDDE